MLNNDLRRVLNAVGNDYVLTEHSPTHWTVVDARDSSIFELYKIKRGYESTVRIYKNRGKAFYRRSLLDLFRRRVK